MVEQASISLSESLTQEEKSSDLVYPRLARIRDISAHVALTVIRTAQAEVRILMLVDKMLPN
jgi:malate dehydrogenase (oxaloacetate-decarboxylating)(NADP+)